MRHRKAPLLYPPAYFLGAVIVMVILHMTVPGPIWLFFPWKLTALLPLLAGLRTMGAAARLFTSHQIEIRPFAPSATLVQEGPYRRSRNPMYLGMTLMLAGVAALLGSLSPWSVVPVFVASITYRFIRPEERLLAEQFGEAYEAYRREVGRWV